MASEMKKVVEAAMPGWKLVEGEAASRYRDGVTEKPAPAEQVGADAAALREKYLKRRSKAPRDPVDSPEPAAAADHHDVKFGRVRSGSTIDSVVGSKTVLVDMDDKKVIGKQG